MVLNFPPLTGTANVVTLKVPAGESLNGIAGGTLELNSPTLVIDNGTGLWATTSSEGDATTPTATSFAKAFVAADFTTGQFSVDAATHGLGLGAGDLAFYQVSVFDSTRELVVIQTSTDALGKVTIGEVGATLPFDGTVLISI
jgi:hypothetical protein